MWNILGVTDDDINNDEKRDKILESALCVNKFLAVTFFLVAGLFAFIFAFLYFGPDSTATSSELTIFAEVAFLVLLFVTIQELYNIYYLYKHLEYPTEPD